jgi:hypothetical protein
MSYGTRRRFLAAGLAAPVAGLASRTTTALGGWQEPSGRKVELSYRTLGRTGFKVTTVGFGCMLTSDPSVIERAAEVGVNYFDTARGYQGGNNERMVGAALKSRRKQVYISTKTGASGKQAALSDLDTSLRELGTDYVRHLVPACRGRSGSLHRRDHGRPRYRQARGQGALRGPEHALQPGGGHRGGHQDRQD